MAGPDLTKLLPKQTQSLLDSSKNNPKPVDHAGKLASVVDKIADQTLTEPFDPLDDAGWIVENPTPIKDIAALTNQLRTDKKVTFTIKLYAQKALFPFAVRGTHHWLSGSSYFAVEQQGPRYVSFNLKKIGHFYASP